MTTLLVNIGGLALIGFVVWWFWLSDKTPGDSGHHH